MDALIFPPYLVEGDKIAIISPAGKIDKTFLKGAKERLESWGLKVVMGKHAAGECGRFSGTIHQRISDFQKAMDDESVKAIFCSRGGYGSIHLIDKLNFSIFKEHPKWLIGYSDITLLHELFQANGFASIHSLMARHLTVEAKEDACALALNNMLMGELPTYHCPNHKSNKTGISNGILRGGNLSVLYGLRGTPYDFPAEGTILFIEDIGERPYHIDRMMHNLKLGGILEKLSGLIVGQFTEYEEDVSFGKEVQQIITDAVKEYNYPVCFDFPVGHTPLNNPLICGAEVELNVGKKDVELRFIK
ncbi:MAG: LD-carboxypeptidase [Bacteroides sp.]